MNKYYITLILFIGLFDLSVTQLSNNRERIFTKKSRPRTLIHYFMNKFFKLCNLNHTKVIIYDHHYTESTISTLINLEPNISITLFTEFDEWDKLHQYKVDDFDVDTVIISVEIDTVWARLGDYFFKWQFNRNCTIYVLPIPIKKCDDYLPTFYRIMLFYFTKVYYICLISRTIRIFTYDLYGDAEPSQWTNLFQEFMWGKNMTIYWRDIHGRDDEGIMNFCQSFDFNRTIPTPDNLFVVSKFDRQFAVYKSIRYNEGKLFNDDIEQYFFRGAYFFISNIKKLTKVTFKYYEISEEDQSRNATFNATGIEFRAFKKAAVILNPYLTFLFPTDYGYFLILSYNKGLMTPLEKIAHYYGRWVLISLIIIIIMTFLTIWYSTKKPGLAAFDIIRLLINTEIFVPIQTLPLKVFFSMIFLYFLVMHATFSGHLAEFLTKIQYRPNIDTIEDLIDPKIKTIYRFGYRYNDDNNSAILFEKTLRVESARQCAYIINEKDSVCIAPSSMIRNVILRHFKHSLYVSKSSFGSSLTGYSVRPGFPFFEKFNWAIIYLFDTGLIDLQVKQRQVLRSETLKRHIASNQVYYRDIQMKDLNFVFFLLIIGNLLGIICLLMEIIVKKCCKFIEWYQHIKMQK